MSDFTRRITILVAGQALLIATFESILVAGDDAIVDLPLIVEETFDDGAARWEPTDAKAWRIGSGPQGNVLSQFQQSEYRPPQRSPLNMALLRDVNVGDFTLEADLLSTTRDYGHRDMCLFFGYQNPSHFYYVHLGKKADDHANQIFIVDGAPRAKISTRSTPGTDWDDQWHHVKIVRRAAEGTIEVYFDDMEEPVMTANDKTFAWGRIGLGSFDDTGQWDNVKLYGTLVERR